MKINLSGVNNTGTGKLISAVMAIHFLILGAIGLDYIGMGVPLLRQAAGIIYLTFIPGILILRLFRLHNLNPLEFLLYSVGLSISFLMFSGLSIDLLYPVLGFSKPLSDLSVIFSMMLFTSIICIVLYKFDIYDGNAAKDQVKDINLLRGALYLSLLFVILLLSILGTYLVNSYHNNSLLLVFIFAIVLLFIYISFDGLSIKQFYPVTVFMVVLSILYSISLISRYLTGYDIQMEYEFYKLAESNSIWNSYLPGFSERSLNMNAMLSVTILPLIYNVFLDIDGVWVFKIIFPFIFAFSFVGLYHVYAKQIGDKNAFFSVMFIVSFIYFMGFEMLSLGRQMIAQLFFVLLLSLMFNQEISLVKKYSIYIIFALSLVVSHYGLSYIYMFILISIFFIKYILQYVKKDTLYSGFFNNNVILIYVLFALSWYMYLSNSAVFNTIVKIGDHVFTSVWTEFFSLGSREKNILMALGIDSARTFSFERATHQKIQLITQFFVIAGSLLSLAKNKFGFSRDYSLFLPVSLGFIFFSLVLPYFSRETMNMTRLYQSTLLILAPFFITGGMVFFGKLINRKCSLNEAIHKPLALKLLVLFVLVPYFLFNTGFIYEITKDEPLLTPLGMERIKTSGSNLSKASLYDAYTPEQDAAGAIWLSNHGNMTREVYTTGVIFLKGNNTQPPSSQTEFGSYIYLRHFNNRDGILSFPGELGELKIVNTSEWTDKIPRMKNKIYTNGGSEAFWLGGKIG